MTKTTNKTTKPTKANLKASANIRILKKDPKLKDTFMEGSRDLQHTDRIYYKLTRLLRKLC